jgi:sugar O-acyltransferase (sialic acid O-acetyltransferase NeuD family)
MRVAVFGSGGMAKEVLAYLYGDDRYVVTEVVSTEYFNNPVYAYKHLVVTSPSPDVQGYILAVADPVVKRTIVEKNIDKWITYVHPSAYISPYAVVGRGCVFAPQSMVCGDPILGDFVFLNTNATVGHDSIIGKFSTLFPNTEVCGDCEVGEGVIFGIGAYALPRVKIVSGAKVSAGAVVRKSVLEVVTVYGDPAKVRIAGG